MKKDFSLIYNNGKYLPEMPRGYVAVYGFKKNAVAYLDYDGNTDRIHPSGDKIEWAYLNTDRDSIMAWHGERQKSKGKPNSVKINWKI